VHDFQTILTAFLMTMIAGLSTGIGGLMVFFTKKTDVRYLAVMLGFSAGVMIYVSLVEIFAEAQAMLSAVYGEKNGMLYTALAFFGGMLFIAIIDKLIPCEENPHEFACPVNTAPHQAARLKRTGVLTALVIALHNLPEGIATFVSATQSVELAIPIVIAIAIHNIPEGISVAMPIYYATGSRKMGLRYALLSGLAEPVGALLAYLILMPFMNDALFGVLFAAVAGIMVFISLDELLPSAAIYGEHHLSMYGLVGGMALMALSLWLFA
jgi:ZIP family zinc transporter